MANIDLHVHSFYSERPSEWILQRIGTKESYTSPEFIYETAKARGMDFVTITDHNRIEGSLMLKEKHPENVFTGIETTTYFPDGCKIHMLLYGINEKQFKAIQLIREDIYDLREYIREHNIAYSVAHATFSVNNLLKAGHLEKLILMFDVFEGVNGARTSHFNNKWMDILKRLTPDRIQSLFKRHKIEPISSDPWVKSFTAGSDDHAGLFIGKTCTICEASTCREALDAIRNKLTVAAGRHNNYKTFAFTLYKVAYDYLSSRGRIHPDSPLALALKMLKMQSMNLQGAADPEKTSVKRDAELRKLGECVEMAVQSIRKVTPANSETDLENVFENLNGLTDVFFSGIFESMLTNIRENDLSSMLMNLLSMAPAVFFTVPFISSLSLLYQNREILDEIESGLNIDIMKNERKILWFTDTLTDLNGVAETIKDLGWHAARKKLPLKIVTSMKDESKNDSIPPNAVFLPLCFSTRLPLYEDYELNFPSLLKSIDMINDEQPTEILISTPGPVGLFGLLMAKLLNIKCTGYYHTDFAEQLKLIKNDSALIELVERSTRWFYSMTDEVLSPTREYIELLADRGFEAEKCRYVHKGIDTSVFRRRNDAPSLIENELGLRNGVTLLYAGRISRDKSLDLLGDVYCELANIRDDINLLIVGAGPYLMEFARRMQDYPRVRFYGRTPRTVLPHIYSASDIFVFPSTTDTFGLVVAESQACGTPAVVSDIGGPKEIIKDGITGYIAKSGNAGDFIEKIFRIINMKENSPEEFKKMQVSARRNICRRFSTENAYRDLFEHDGGVIKHQQRKSSAILFEEPDPAVTESFGIKREPSGGNNESFIISDEPEMSDNAWL